MRELASNKIPLLSLLLLLNKFRSRWRIESRDSRIGSYILSVKIRKHADTYLTGSSRSEISSGVSVLVISTLATITVKNKNQRRHRLLGLTCESLGARCDSLRSARRKTEYDRECRARPPLLKRVFLSSFLFISLYLSLSSRVIFTLPNRSRGGHRSRPTGSS